MKLRHMMALALLASVPLTTMLAGCSSDDASTTTTSGTVSVLISAAAGGTVTDAAGTVSLAIPAGALEKDTTITLATSPQIAGVISSVYDFGPDGLKFLKPATLKIKATPPADKNVAIAYEEGGTWKQLSGSTVDAASGMVVANTDHFTKYAVVIVDGQAVLQPPSTCAEATAQFAACGGDPSGSWTFAEFCIDASGIDPLDGKCPSATATIEITDTRVITIDATTIKNGAGTQTVASTLNIPQTCLTANNATCDQVSSPADNRTCAMNADTCVCNTTETEQKAETNDTYTTSGNTITITESDGSTTTGEYCVKQNLLYFKETGGNGLLYVLNRK